MLVQTLRDKPREEQELSRSSGQGVVAWLCLVALWSCSVPWGLCSLAGSLAQLRSSALSSRITLLTKYFALT